MRRIESLAVLVVFVLLVSLTALDLSGHRLFVVGGASMEPAISKGSLVIARETYPVALGVGDVVTFQHHGDTVTHRIAAVSEYGDARVFTTKGDANAAADPDSVTFDDRAGLVVAQVPLAGYLVSLVQFAARALATPLLIVVLVLLLRRRVVHTFPSPVSA